MAILYVFWHGPHQGIEPARYEAALAAFLAALAARAEADSLALAATSGAVGPLPWRNVPGPLWQDAYRVEDMAALERLEAMAVGAGVESSHGVAAAMAGHGQAGLYRSLGPTSPVAAAVSGWLDKPPESARGPFEAALVAAAAGIGASVWRRVLTLSPGPEFLVRAPQFLAPGAAWPGAHIVAERTVATHP